MSVIEGFARFIAATEPPEQAMAAARLRLLDWMGAAIAGSVEMPATALRAALPGQGPSRLLPDGAPADPRTAALINGTASHTVEVDDIFRYGLYHPGVATVPAALALAEATHASGRELLRAIVLGYETGNRIARAVSPSHYRYWHTTATVGHFGATAAAAAVLRLDAGQTAHALGTVATFAAGLRHAFSADAMSKPLHAGRAAEAGVLAALAAREGVTGVMDMLEGERGFGTAMAEDCDWPAELATLGTEWTVTDMTTKAHACCGHSFAALDAIAELCREHDLAPADIEAIELRCYQATLDICGNPDPATPAEARFSLPFCAGVIATAGAVTPNAFTETALADPAVRAIAARTRLALDPDAEARFPSRRSDTALIRTTDGRDLTRHRPTRRGDPDDPMSPEEIAHKFRALAVPVIGEASAKFLVESISAIETLSDICDTLYSSPPEAA